jgi:hypothetical protein
MDQQETPVPRFDAYQSITNGFTILKEHLDPIIARTLAPELHGLPWTAILEQLDIAKGKKPGDYSTSDPQDQLRIITDRLGKIGFPFSDKKRKVQAYSNSLKVFRNAWAHFDPLSILDAFRMNDNAARLLEHFGDIDGSMKLDYAANNALRAYVYEAGIVSDSRATANALIDTVSSGGGTGELANNNVMDRNAAESEPPQPAPVNASSEDLVVEPLMSEPGDSAQSYEGTLVEPGPDVLERKDGGDTPLVGNSRIRYEPWPAVEIGNASVLDDLPKRYAKEKVRALASEITEFEGPIEIDRLASLIGNAFGLSRIKATRRGQIKRHIRAADVVVDGDGFVWPTDIDPDTWTEFRPNDSNAGRAFTDISPVEIANAMRFIREKNPGISEEDLDTKTLQTFGRKKRTSQVKAHLALARKHLVTA